MRKKIDILSGRRAPRAVRKKEPATPGTRRYRVKLDFVFTMPADKTICMTTNPTLLAMAAVRALTTDAIDVLGGGTAEYTNIDWREVSK